MLSSKPNGRKYPPHLYTLEFHLHDLSLPILYHHYHTDESARAALQVATKLMNKSNNAIDRIRLWHKHTLLVSVSPSALPSPKPLPAPSPDGVRRLPPASRAISRTPPKPPGFWSYDGPTASELEL